MSINLCEDLLVEIFSRLAPKPLLRFRSVSKSLRLRISSPDFIRLHALRSPKTFTIIHETCYKGVRDPKTIYTIHSEGDQLSSYAGITPVDYPFQCITNIVGSCNGVICVYEYTRHCIHLWNPSIRRKVTLHVLPHSGDSLAHGFGFDPIINDYKILRTSKAGTFVYTMKKCTWREIPSPATQISFVTSSQCLLNGTLHWVVEKNPAHSFSHYYILTFNLSSEVFSTIELPDPSWGSVPTIINGCLGVICSKDDGDRWIWVRNSTSTSTGGTGTSTSTIGITSWCVAFKLNTRERATHGDVLFSHNYPKGIVIFNPETKARSKLARLTESSSIVSMTTCIESLELLDKGTTCDQDIERKRKGEEE